MKLSSKRINLIYLSLVTLLVAGGTFEGLLKLVPDSAMNFGRLQASRPVATAPVAAAPALITPVAAVTSDSITQSAAAPVQQQAPIRVPIISTVPLDTVHVASPHFPASPARHGKTPPRHSQNHS